MTRLSQVKNQSAVNLMRTHGIIRFVARCMAQQNLGIIVNILNLIGSIAVPTMVFRKLNLFFWALLKLYKEN